MRQHLTSTMRTRMASNLLFSTLFAAALLLAACNRGDAAADAAQASTGDAPPSALTVSTAPVVSQQLVRKVPATGSIFPWQEVIIAPEVGGYRVAEVMVDVGSRVRKGQELVRLSGDLLQAEVNARRAGLRSAEAGLANAAAALRRGETVSTSGALSAADLDRLRAEHIAMQAQVDTARSDLETAELRLRYTTVRAPDDGTITTRTVSVGQIAQAGAEMLRMLRQNRVEWRAEVPEAELSRIKAGQAVQISTADGQTLQGSVRMVAPTVQANTRVGLVYVDIEGGAARPGMFARGQIEAGSGEGLLVPYASVVTQDGYSYVYVLGEGNVVERRRIELVGVHDDMLEIAAGVAEGDVIAVKGAGFLKDGDTVTVANAGNTVSAAQAAR